MPGFRHQDFLFVLQSIVTLCFLCPALCIANGDEKEVTDQPNQQKLAFFETRIRPVLVMHCYSCHSADAKNIRGGLLLDTQSGLLTGGDSGPAIVPGNPEDSILIDALKHETVEMPPDQKFSDAIIHDFESWISQGAIDPRVGDSKVAKRAIDIDKGREFWAFHPVRKSEVPQIASDWPRTHVDRLLLAAHQTKAKHDRWLHAPDAGPDIVLRRLTFVLTGLVPTVEEQRSFAAAWDENPEMAIESAVDQLLASPRFGERWGRHWLDVARFAESTGGGRSMMLPDAWRFRDYVIRSFHQDKPFNQLVREHLAGDLLPYSSDDQHDEQVIGSGYLMMGAINYEEQDKEQLRMDVVDEQIDSMGRSFLGMTLGCCRCHDHKFDPIPASDYYALAGIFRSTKSLTPGNVCGFVTRPLKQGFDKSGIDQWTAEDKQLEQSIAAIRKQLGASGASPRESSNPDRPKAPSLEDLDGAVVDDSDAVFEGTWVQSKFQQPFVGEGYRHSGMPRTGTSATYKVSLPTDGEYVVRMVINHSEGRSERVPLLIVHADGESIVYVNQRLRPSDGIFASIGKFRFESIRPAEIIVKAMEADPGFVICDAIQFVPIKQMNLLASANDSAAKTETIDEARRKSLRDELKSLEERRKGHEKQKPEVPVAMCVEDEQQIGDWHLHVRGEIRNLGPVVPRGFLQVATPADQSPALVTAIHGSEVAKTSGRVQLADWMVSKDNPLTSRVYVNRVWLHVFGEGIVRTPDNFGETGERPDLPELLDDLAHRFVHEYGWSTKKLVRELCLSRAFRMSSVATDEAVQLDPENRLMTRSHRRRLDAESVRDALLQVSGELNLSQTSGRTIGKLGTYDSEYRHADHPLNLRSVFVPSFRNAVLDLFEVFDGANPNLVTGKRTRSTRPAQALYLMNSPFVMTQAEKAATSFLASTSFRPDDPEYSLRLVVRRCLSREATSQEVVAMLNVVGEDPNSIAGWTSVFHALFASVDFRFIE